MTARVACDDAGLAMPATCEFGVTRIADPEPLVLAGNRWTKWLGPVVSVLILALSAAMLVMRKRVFILPRRELWFVAFINACRIVGMLLLAALLWHLLLPEVALSWWVLLGTTRQLLSRLPFLPNKDVVFAGIAAFLVGSNVEIAAAIALFSALVLGAHMMVGLLVRLIELADEGRQG
jgi:hypothetical protein